MSWEDLACKPDCHDLDAWIRLGAAVIRRAIISGHPQNPARLELVKDIDEELDLCWGREEGRRWVEDVFKDNAYAMNKVRRLWSLPFRECIAELGQTSVCSRCGRTLAQEINWDGEDEEE